MTKQETMRLLLIDVRAYLRNRSMDAVYEQGRREGLLQAIDAALKPSAAPKGDAHHCETCQCPEIEAASRVNRPAEPA
jgi:hypothetical protein